MYTLYPFHNDRKKIFSRKIGYKYHNNYIKLPMYSLYVRNNKNRTLNKDIAHLLNREKLSEIYNENSREKETNFHKTLSSLKKNHSNKSYNDSFHTNSYQKNNKKKNIERKRIEKPKEICLSSLVNIYDNNKFYKNLEETNSTYKLTNKRKTEINIEDSVPDNLTTTNFNYFSNNETKVQKNNPTRPPIFKNDSNSTINILEFNSNKRNNFMKFHSMSNISLKKTQNNNNIILRNSGLKDEKRKKYIKIKKKSKIFNSSLKAEIFNYNDLFLKLKRIGRLKQNFQNVQIVNDFKNKKLINFGQQKIKNETLNKKNNNNKKIIFVKEKTKLNLFDKLYYNINRQKNFLIDDLKDNIPLRKKNFNIDYFF